MSLEAGPVFEGATSDHVDGTRIAYTYFVSVRRRAFRPVYAWLVRTLALPFWEKSVIGELRKILETGEAKPKP
jgi:hypothetical protein